MYLYLNTTIHTTNITLEPYWGNHSPHNKLLDQVERAERSHSLRSFNPVHLLVPMSHTQQNKINNITQLGYMNDWAMKKKKNTKNSNFALAPKKIKKTKLMQNKGNNSWTKKTQQHNTFMG